MECFDCPVKCGRDRKVELGVFKAPYEFVVSHADLHREVTASLANSYDSAKVLRKS